jgi:hypothetical protein
MSPLRRRLTASISLICGQLLSSLFFFDFHRTNFFGFRRTFHQFRSGWLCYFCYSRAGRELAAEGHPDASAATMIIKVFLITLVMLLMRLPPFSSFMIAHRDRRPRHALGAGSNWEIAKIAKPTVETSERYA